MVLGILLCLLFRCQLFLIRVTHAGNLADALHKLVTAGDVHPFDNQVKHDHGNLRRHRCELLQQAEQFFGLRLSDAGPPILVADDEVGLAAGDVVLGQPVIHLDVFRGAAHVGDAELFLLAEILLDEGKLLLPVQLNGKAQVIEDPGGGHGPLLLAATDSQAAGGIGLTPHILVRHAGQALDHGDRPAHQVQVRRGQLALGVDCQVVPLLLHQDGVGAAHLVTELVKVFNSTLVHDHLVGG